MTANVASPRQIAFILDMLAEVFPGQPAADVLAAAVARGGFATRDAVRTSIDALIARRDAVRAAARSARPAAAVTPSVPFGHYALPGAEAGAWEFYVVREGKGKWAGRTFVNRYRSDYTDRLTAGQQSAIMGRIAADVETAGQAFARETRHCRRCARRLTDIPTAERNGGWGPECVKMV